MPLTLLTTAPLSPGALPVVAVPALYVHIPFCFHKCHYCDFYSITRQSDERMTRFVDLVLAEGFLVSVRFGFCLDGNDRARIDALGELPQLLRRQSPTT